MIERAGLAQHLYVAASLDAHWSTGTLPLRAMVRTIALQEMAQFTPQQNIPLAVRGANHLKIGCDTLLAKRKDNPMPFAPEPVTDLTLSEYVLVEAFAVTAEASPGYRFEVPRVRVKKEAGIEPHRIADFHAHDYWSPQPFSSPQGRLSP